MLMGQISGPLAEPELATAGKAAVKVINDAGGVNGHPLQLILCDDQGNPNLNAACGHTAVSDGVVAVVGSLSLYDQNILPILAAANIADISQISVAPQDNTNPNSFPVNTTPTSYSGIGADLSAQGGCKEGSIIVFNIAASLPNASYIKAGFKEFGGDPNMRVVPVSPTTTDYTAAMAAATSGGIHCIALATGGAATTGALIAAQKLGGVTVSADAGALTIPAVAALHLPDGMLRVESIYHLPGTGTPAADAFVTAAKAIDPGVNTNELAENSYNGVLTFADIAKGLSDVTAANFLAAVKQANNVDTGLTAPVDFAAVPGPVASLSQIIEFTVFPYVWKNNAPQAAGNALDVKSAVIQGAQG
jgi:branched-chain amino acid transport system substrate-binding protein